VEVRQRPDEVEEGRSLERDGVHQGILNHPRTPEQAKNLEDFVFRDTHRAYM
jgi:hypothetical protein